MKIELLKPYGLSSPGDVIETNAGVAEQLILRGIAREVKPEKRGGKSDSNKAFYAPPKQ